MRKLTCLREIKKPRQWQARASCFARKGLVMNGSEIDAIRTLLSSKPRPVGGGRSGANAWTRSVLFGL
jgi:hypothetical protein